MRGFYLSSTLVLLAAIPASAANIEGEYLEARSCDVYTGPCFANAEMDIAGRDALMAWKVDSGSFNGVSLNGLGAALILNSERTLGDDGIFGMKPGKIRSVLLVDEKATKEQREALVGFVKKVAKDYTQEIVRVQSAPMTLKNDHLEGAGTFQAGKLASIKTRELRDGDCVCTNEIVYYKPLTDVDNFHPVYSKEMSFQGQGLNNQWSYFGMRSAFQATFRY
jgi:hypothetical protein